MPLTNSAIRKAKPSKPSLRKGRDASRNALRLEQRSRDRKARSLLPCTPASNPMAGRPALRGHLPRALPSSRRDARPSGARP